MGRQRIYDRRRSESRERLVEEASAARQEAELEGRMPFRPGPGRVDISERPAEAKERIGDWEPSSAKLTVELSLVDRTTKYTLLGGQKDRRYGWFGHDPPARLWCAIGPHNHVRQRSSQTTGVSHLTQISSSPFHSWERGLSEHTNGLVREYFPKGTDFRATCNEDVQKVQDRLNTRKVLGSPTEVILK